MPRRLLLVDDATTRRIVLRAKLAAAGYVVDLARDIAGVQDAIAHNLPDAALISSDLPEGHSGQLARLLGARGTLRRVPVILICQRDDEVAPGEAIDAVLPMNAGDAMTLARVRSVLRVRDLEEELSLRANTCREMGLCEDPATFAPRANVLIASRTADGGQVLADQLTAHLSANIEVMPVAAAVGGQAMDGFEAFDVVLLESGASEPALDLHCLSDLRCRAQTRHASIIFRLPAGAETEAAMALDLGAADVVLGDRNVGFLVACIEHQLAHQQMVRGLRAQVNDGLRLAVIDPLTGLHNRRYALRHLERLAARVTETGRTLAVMMVDIDRFKDVNDRFGHDGGDRVIRAVGDCLKANLRSADLVSRYGGEEYLVTMPDTSEVEAIQAAERLRARIASLSVPIGDGLSTGVTLSIGVAVEAVGDGSAPRLAQGMIRNADEALYAAKRSGRNRVTIWRTAA